MTHLKFTFPILSICLAVFCCSCEQEQQDLLSGSGVVATFTTSFGENMASDAENGTQPPTRVNDNKWSGNEIVGIMAFNAETHEQITNDFHQYTPNEGMNGTHVQLVPVENQNPICYPTNGDKVTFTAFAPYPSESDQGMGYAIKEGNWAIYNLSSQSTVNPKIMENLDFIYHKGTISYSQASPVATLNFEHKLSRIIINLTSAENYDIEGSTATINRIFGMVNCNLSDGAIQPGDAGAEITAARTTDDKNIQTFQAIVAPQSKTSVPPATDRTLTFRVDSQNHTIEIPQEWEAGKSYTYNFVFDVSGITLAGSTVVNWGAGTVAWGGECYLTTSDSTIELGAISPIGTLIVKTKCTDKKPAVTTSISVNDCNAGEVDWISTASLDAGTLSEGWTNYTLTITANTNTGTTSRMGYVHLSLDELSVIINIDQSAISAQADGLANCYIVHPGRTVTIPITRAITIGGMSPNSEVEIAKLWEDATVFNNAIISGEGANRIISITTKKNEGNVLIALKDAGGIIRWSWHIWVVDIDLINTWIPNFGSTAKYRTFMDRNLGATANDLSEAAQGLFYQWGRKDPFPRTDIAGYSVENGPVSLHTAIQNPNKFYSHDSDWLSSPDDMLWDNNSTKTVYDPCPSGWRVPVSGSTAKSPWYGLVSQTYSQGASAGYDWNLRSTNARWPAGGARLRTTGELYTPNSNGYVWSSTPIAADAYSMRILNNSFSSNTYHGRAEGFKVRCVSDIESTPKPTTTVDNLANCYMIKTNESIRIPITRAESFGGMTSGVDFTVTKIWDDNNVVSTCSANTEDRHITVIAGINEGNALIAIRDANNIIRWSWHIWVVNDLDYTNTWMPNIGSTAKYRTFMDRNLGATANNLSDAARGLLYQWGRKDPFPCADFVIEGSFTKNATGPVSLNTSIENPDKFYISETTDWLDSPNDNLWEGGSSQKSIYDPCPHGWRVPPSGELSASPWFNLSKQDYTMELSTSGIYWGASSQWPTTGSRGYNNGELSRLNTHGFIWSGTAAKNSAYSLDFTSGILSHSNMNYRAFGLGVRCVSEYTTQ